MNYCRIVSLLTLAVFSGLVQAKTAYIDDVIYVPLRSGPNNVNKIIHHGLKSGTALKVLGENKDDFTKVRTSKGLEGYVRSQYLRPTPIARDQVASAQKQVQKLKDSNKTLKQELKTLKSTNSSLGTQSSKSASENSRLSSELARITAISGEAISLVDRNKTLVADNMQLKNRIEALEMDNERLNSSSDHKWYTYGAGTILLGIFLGLVAPSLRTRRKNNSEWV